MKSRTLSAMALAIGLALSTAVAASTPNDVRDLVGARASSGDSALQSRGYVHIETSKCDDRSYGQSWSPSRQTCLPKLVSIKNQSLHP
jgi:hypothetical protein